MTYVIGETCVDVLDRACVAECPFDCIYEGERMPYIHPDECVDGGACEPACPVEAIYYEDDLPDQWQVRAGRNALFFAEPLPGHDEPLGSPGAAARLGLVGADTPFVAALPRRETADTGNGAALRHRTGGPNAAVPEEPIMNVVVYGDFQLPVFLPGESVGGPARPCGRRGGGRAGRQP